MRRRGRRRRGRGRNTTAAMVQLTSLMDIFTTLLLFLLKSYVVDGQSGTVMPGVTLPPSVSRTQPHDAPVIAVTHAHIVFEGESVLDSQKAIAQEDLTLAPLYDKLVALREKSEMQPEFEPRITLQGDRQIPFRLLQRVMYTSQLAGYTQVSLAVLQDDAAVETAAIANE